MINLRSKAKPEPKKAQALPRVPRRRVGYLKDAFTPEDIVEMNLVSRLVARDNARLS